MIIDVFTNRKKMRSFKNMEINIFMKLLADDVDIISIGLTVIDIARLEFTVFCF